MAKRSINSNIESHLINNEPFEYAHLVKFERPFHPKNGEFRTNSGRYVFLTDGARDISFDADGDGNTETYRANGILSVGSYSETTQARATGMSLTIAGETLGTSVTVTGNLNSSGTFTTTGDFVNGEILDFVEQGFREGDKIKIEKANGTNFADGASGKIYIISGFTDNNQTITFARTGEDIDDSTFITLNSTSFTFTILNEEVHGALLDKGTKEFTSISVTNNTNITLENSNSKIQIGQLVTGQGVEEDSIVTSINGTSLVLSKTQKSIGAGEKLTFTNPSFVNREVFIYKVFLDTEGSIVGSSSVLVFKGIVNSTNIQESPTSSRVKWNLSSHWGDFDAVVGRLTTDEIHRALDTNGKPSIVMAERPEYATDLGFLHAESSLNTISVYQTTETRYELETKRRGGVAGLLGGKKQTLKEIQEQVDNEVDLSVFLQGKYLPVVYGVQRVNGIPVFADTKSNNSKEIYVVYAISEGENHGIYNLYIDGAPLICIDKSDYDVRNTSAIGSDSNQLQCYGRADQGGTLGGTVVTGSTNYTDFDMDDFHDYDGGERTYTGTKRSIVTINRRFESYNENSIPEASVTDSAEGLQHKETASIYHPFNMHFTFYSGRSYQAGDNNLSDIAASNGFKRQSDYYSGDEAYWSPDHKLLDTAYAVMKFTIDADQTTVPDIEYVVKGKVLECHNYDGTYVPDEVLGTSDAHTNFNEGDIVEVQYSSNDFSTSSSAGTNFRILDKYQFTTARGEQHYRFRLDSIPNIEDNTQVRLKSGANYWHMVTHDHAVIGTSTTLPSQSLSVTSLQTNANGLLTATLPSATVTDLQALYPNISSSASTSDAMIQFTGDTDGIFTSLKNAVFQATLSGNTLTFPGTSFSANQSSTGTLSGINIQAAEVFDFSTISDISGITDTNEIVGCDLQIVETGESRRITAFNTTTNYATIEAPFITPPTSSNTFKITGRGKDLRSSINPAIQTLDLLTNSRYGKGLDLTNDIDLDSVKAAALLCDTRSDVTIPLSSAASCGAGDVYKLTDDGTSSGNHVASGKVLNATSSSSKVIFTDVSGKFIRNYENYISYKLGDVVTNIVNGQSEYYRVTSGAGYKTTAPSHTTGTINGFEHLTTLTLHKVSGSGPSTLSVAKDGRLLTYSLYDSDFVKYWRYIGWEENRQWCVTRHQTNFIFDTSRSIFENVNALLSHYNGILSYSNGKYVLDVETQATTPTASISNGIQSNPLYISNDDIIGDISLVDNSQRNSKNTIKASIADPQNNFSSRSVSFFNSDFLKADRNKVKTGSYPVTGITSYYNARIGIEKELIQSRYTKEISFTVGPRGLLLKPGEVIALTYAPFGFESKLFRIENLTYAANCNTQVKAREYDDSIYAITPQVSSSAQKAASGGNLQLVTPGLPTSLTATTTKPGIITLNWTNTTGNSVVSKDYKEIIDSTEIWRASTQGSSGSVHQHASLIAVVDNASTYNDALAEAGNFYYWIRHRRLSSQTSSNASVLLTGDFNTAITAGVEGTAKVLSPQLDVDISSIQIKFDDANVLSPTGAAQDVTLTATVRNITPNASGVIFTLVDADQSSQNDVQFTNGNSTVTDTSSPYQATVDASTFEHDTTNKFVKVQVTDTSGETFTELVSATVTKDGSSGSIGADAIAVKLEASQYVISYSAQGTETDSISLSTTLQGSGEFSGTPYYEFIVDGSSDQNSTTTTYTLPDGDEPAVNENKTITVKVRDGSTTGTVKATDSISVYGIESGSDSTTAFLTNSAHVVPTNESGVIDSSLITSGNINNAGGTFKVYIGTTDRTTSCTYAVQSESGVDATIGASTGVYTIASSGLGDYGVAVFRVTVPSNISPTGTSFTIDQTYTIAKSKKGNQGADGDDAKTVRLTAGDYSIVYDADGANPDPSGTITLTATSQNFTDGHFKFTGDGITDETSYTDGITANSDTFSFTVPSAHFTTPKSLRVGVSEGTAASTEIAFDTINIFAVKEGSNAYTVILDNESHAIPADENGANLNFTGSGATISIFKGSTELNGITTGTPTSGEFKVTATGSGITPSSTNGTSTGDPVIFADHSGMTGTSASITYTINIENIQTVLKKQTFTRVDKGDTGATGASAVTVLLTNESTTAQQYSLFGVSGTIIYTGTGGEMKLYDGATEQTSGVVYGGSGFTDNGATRSKTQNGLTCTINESTGVYSFTGSAWSSNNEEFTLQATYDNVTYSKVVSINKVAALQKVSLSADNQVFKFATSSATAATPTSITLTATAFTYAGTIQYKWYKNDVAISSVNSGDFGATSSITVDDGSFSDGNDVYKVEARNNTISSTKFDEDEITIVRLADGAEGDPGADGDNVAQVQIYLRSSSSSTPSTPSSSETYSFTSGAITSTPIASASGNWSETVPSGSGQYLWTCKATAIGANGANSTSIGTGIWSTPQLQSEAQQPRVDNIRVYYDDWNFGSLPSSPSNTNMAFNFSTRSLTGLPSGWNTSVPATPYAYSDVTIAEDTFEDSNPTFTVGPVRPRGGKFDIIDLDDIDIGFQDVDNIRIRFGNTGLGTTTYQTGSVNSGLKNTSISINADGKITGANTAFNSVVLSNDKIVSSNVVGTGKLFATTLPEDGATLGATAGTNLKDSGGSTLGDEDVRNDDLQIDYSGTTVRIKKGATTVIDSQAAPAALKNDQISLTASGGTVTLNNASTTNNTFTKASIALNNVTNDAQVKSDLSNLSVESANLEVISGELRPKATLKNSDLRITSDSNNLRIRDSGNNILDSVTGLGQGLVNLSGVENNATEGATAGTNIKDSGDNVLGDDDLKNASITLNADGSLANIGTSQVLSNSKIAETDLVGTGKVFATGQKPNKTVLSGNNLVVDGTSQGAVKNSGISLSLSGTSLSLTGGGGSAQTFNKSSVGLSDLNSLESGTGTKLSGIESGATVGAKAGTNLVDSSNNALGDEDVRNSDLSIDFTGNTTFRIKKGTTVIDSQAFNKTNVGLSDLNSLESGTGTKLSGIESGATVGATAGTNLKDSGNNTLTDEDVRNSDLVITKSGQNVQIKKGSTLIDSVGLDKGTVGLSDLASLDSTSSSKLGGIESGATVGAIAGTNIKDSGGTVLGDTAIKNSSVTLAKSAGNGTTGATFSLTNGNAATVALTAADAQVASDSSGINIAGTRKATHNGTAINTSGNVVSSMTVASGGSIVIGNITIDGTNGRILITD